MLAKLKVFKTPASVLKCICGVYGLHSYVGGVRHGAENTHIYTNIYETTYGKYIHVRTHRQTFINIIDTVLT